MRAKRLGWLWLVTTAVLGCAAWAIEEYSDFPTFFLEILFGAIVATLFTLYMEVLKQPDVVIELHNEGKPAPMQLGPNVIFVVRLRAVNRPLARYLQRLGLVRDEVSNARGQILFVRTPGSPVPSSQMDGSPLLPEHREAMPVRWTNSAQPFDRLRVSEGKRNYHLTVTDPERLTESCSISPVPIEGAQGGEGVLDVAYQYDGEPAGYGLSNECYLTDWRPTRWELAAGDYLIHVTVKGLNAQASGTFRLSVYAKQAQCMRLSRDLDRSSSQVCLGG